MQIRAEFKIRDRLPKLIGEGEVDAMVEAIPGIEDAIKLAQRLDPKLEVTQVNITVIMKNKE